MGSYPIYNLEFKNDQQILLAILRDQHYDPAAIITVLILFRTASICTRTMACPFAWAQSLPLIPCSWNADEGVNAHYWLIFSNSSFTFSVDMIRISHHF